MTELSQLNPVHGYLPGLYASEDIGFALFTKQTAVNEIGVCDEEELPAGVACFDPMYDVENTGKYIDGDPVKVAGTPGDVVPVKLKKTEAIETPESNPVGTYVYVVDGGYVQKETDGIRTATSVAKLQEDGSYTALEAAGTVKTVLVVLV